MFTFQNETSSLNMPTFFGLSIPTHRSLSPQFLEDGNENDDGSSSPSSSFIYFPYEPIIAAISILFFRITVKVQRQSPQQTLSSLMEESILVRYVLAILLGMLAYTQQSYQHIVAAEISSYMISYIVLYVLSQQQFPTKMITTTSPYFVLFQRSVYILIGAVVSVFLSYGIVISFCNPILQQLFLDYMVPNVIKQAFLYLFPILELQKAYRIMEQFMVMDQKFFYHMIHHLFFVTFHIQVGMGYLGIAFLRSEQSRRNQLIRLDVYDDAETEDDNNDDRHHPRMNGVVNNGNDTTSHNEQKKKNKENQMAEKSRIFQKGAAPFIFLSALPYMAQIILYGNINHYAYVCVQDELHRTIRYRQVFRQDNHLLAMANDSPTSPEAYASSMNTVISTAYEIFNRKLFSLPKVLLLPAVMSRQPLLIAQVFPFIFASDWFKAAAVTYMTTKIEALQKEINEISAVRSKVESFDIKNAELLQRSGKHATQFTQRRWEMFTIQVQSRQVISELLGRGKGFFAFMQRNFIFTVLIDCALANLISIGKIVPAEIFVYSRAIEDAVDMLLMRSRGEAELARMITEIDKLDKLRVLWDSKKKPNLLKCMLDDTSSITHSGNRHNKIVLRNLHYSRGTAMARADHIELVSGIYALTGANGSGKSTLFRILMSCDTNEKQTELPASINLLSPADPLTEEDDIRRASECLAALDDNDDDITSETSCGEVDSNSGRELHPRSSITMPSKHVVEISQNFYWPLYSKPIDWILQDDILSNVDKLQIEKRVRKVAEQLHELQFFQSKHEQNEKYDSAIVDEGGNLTIRMDGTVDPIAKTVVEFTSESTIQRIMMELLEEKDDWFSDLSGGQKSKVELVRTVFLRDSCPDVLLVDETMAPLDPASKELVMSKLKKFCANSIIIVIYHTDVGQGKEIEGKIIDCVRSNDFFDKNIHLEKGIVHLRDTC